MGLKYRIEGDLLIITGGGKWTTSDMKVVFGKAAQEAGSKRLKGALLDDRDSEFNARHNEFEDMARFHRDLSDRLGSRMAIVVSDDLHWGLARVASAVHEYYGIEIEIFMDLEEARSWLIAE